MPRGANANLAAVYHYGTSLETGSARFSQPGDFFIYLIFVGSVIMVSGLLDPGVSVLGRAVFSFSLPFHFTSHICPPSLILAEAVPGSEEDYPCISCSTALFAILNGAACGVGTVG